MRRAVTIGEAGSGAVAAVISVESLGGPTTIHLSDGTVLATGADPAATAAAAYRAIARHFRRMPRAMRNRIAGA